MSLLATAISLSLLAPSAPLEAATINVSGACTLIKAVNEGNSEGSEADCTDGDAAGTDTVLLQSNSTHSLHTANNNTLDSNGLPAITSSIFIEGNGATITRISAATFDIFTLPLRAT